MHKTGNPERSVAHNRCLTMKNLQTQKALNLATHSSIYRQTPVNRPTTVNQGSSWMQTKIAVTESRNYNVTKITHQMHEATKEQQALSFVYHRGVTEKNPYIKPTVNLAIHSSVCQQGSLAH